MVALGDVGVDMVCGVKLLTLTRIDPPRPTR